MYNSKKVLFLFLLINLSLFLFSDIKTDWETEKDKAEKLFNSAKYDESIILFREIINSSANDKIKIEAYFWLAKAYMNIDRLRQAEVNLEHYLKNYESVGLNYSEAVYEKGRLLFLQEEYQSSVEQLKFFIDKYPNHKLISNAYYWIGECLYALGQFDDSAFFFNIVMQKYPRSIKREASAYKLRLIEHKKSELVLQNLLKWSQEQYLSALTQFRIKEKTLTQALEDLKKNNGSGGIDSQSEEYKKLIYENEKLQEKIRRLEEQVSVLQENLSGNDLFKKMQQLELKEELLKNKEETLKVFEEELRKKEKSLE